MVMSALVVLYIARGLNHPGDRASWTCRVSIGEQKLKLDQQLTAKENKKGQTLQIF